MTDEEKKAIEKIKKILYMFPESEELKLLLNLIEKQSKEIEHWKAGMKIVEKDKNNHIERLDKEIEHLKYIIDCKTNEIKTLTNDFISKNKIKAKIEEYKKQIAKMEKDDVGIGFTLGKEWSDLKAKIEFGQSLLEKE